MTHWIGSGCAAVAIKYKMGAVKSWLLGLPNLLKHKQKIFVLEAINAPQKILTSIYETRNNKDDVDLVIKLIGKNGIIETMQFTELTDKLPKYIYVDTTRAYLTIATDVYGKWNASYTAYHGPHYLVAIPYFQDADTLELALEGLYQELTKSGMIEL